MGGRLRQAGFTLVELVITIVLLAILAIATSDFIRSGALIFSQGADRQALLGEARFAIQRINQELRNALPNSASVTQGGACLSFVPIASSGTFVDLPSFPASGNQVTLVPTLDQSALAGVYPIASYILSAAEILNGNALINANCSTQTLKQHCVNIPTVAAGATTYTASLVDNAGAAQAVSFAATSPSQRYYLLNQPVAFCIKDNELHRFSPPPTNLSQENGGLLARHLSTAAGDNGFTTVPPSLSRNGLINLRFRFVDGQEYLDFNYDITVPNQP